jgi:hypothetical protein
VAVCIMITKFLEKNDIGYYEVTTNDFWRSAFLYRY